MRISAREACVKPHFTHGVMKKVFRRFQVEWHTDRAVASAREIAKVFWTPHFDQFLIKFDLGRGRITQVNWFFKLFCVHGRIQSKIGQKVVQKNYAGLISTFFPFPCFVFLLLILITHIRCVILPYALKENCLLWSAKFAYKRIHNTYFACFLTRLRRRTHLENVMRYFNVLRNTLWFAVRFTHSRYLFHCNRLLFSPLNCLYFPFSICPDPFHNSRDCCVVL